jgi:hypothetical protein
MDRRNKDVVIANRGRWEGGDWVEDLSNTEAAELLEL